MAGVLLGATLWGLSGTAAQELFRHWAVAPVWLLAVRMLAAGAGLAALSGSRGGAGLPRIGGADRGRVVGFGIAGLAAVQYTYLAAIRDGNAVVATLLQDLGPVLLMGWTALRERRGPTGREIAAWLLALGGTALLLTDGRLGPLWVPPSAVAWGLGSAVAAAFYTAYPRPLILRYGARRVVGWGLLAGGLPFAPALVLVPPPSAPAAWALVGCVALLGTLAAFTLYLASLAWLRPLETSLLATAEPLAATAAGVGLLHVPFDGWMALGAAGIVAAVVLLAGTPPGRAAGRSSAVAQ
ncbi:MAG: DMT family transporter [Actinomycetia bacterium]|nr:DMT family transporter [Actinomycetes bacterium]